MWDKLKVNSEYLVDQIKMTKALGDIKTLPLSELSKQLTEIKSTKLNNKFNNFHPHSISVYGISGVTFIVLVVLMVLVILVRKHPDKLKQYLLTIIGGECKPVNENVASLRSQTRKTDHHPSAESDVAAQMEGGDPVPGATVSPLRTSLGPVALA